MAVAQEQSGRPGAPARPDRNLALELVRVTEAAAMGAGRWIGRGDKEAADQAAVDAMRAMLDSVSMDGVVVIGEGEKDEAPMLYNGEHVGDGSGPEVVDAGLDPERVLTTDDLVKGQDVFVAATGVTTGALLRGVRYLPNGAVTDSIVMRSRSGTVRRVEATHALDKLETFTGREYR